MDFSLKIINWYLEHHRDLPWRNTSTPYHIWLSEIILQQTRVNQGLVYYLRFIENYPTVQHLADAPIEKVLKDWQGLGYYSRARNLHATAKVIREKFHGRFPDTYENILSLKGIGPYTAAAIGSIAFGLPYPVIDGNVMRVIARYFGIDSPVNTPKGAKEIAFAVAEVFDPSQPGTFNQAIMEFGAVFCKPGKPDCKQCIFADQCRSFAEGTVEILPVKEKKLKIRERHFHYIVIRDQGYTYIEQRTGKDIWNQLFQFPCIESGSEMTLTEISSAMATHLSLNPAKITIEKIVAPVKHILTHQRLMVSFMEIRAEKLQPPATWLRIKEEKLKDYAVPVIIQRYLESRGLN